MTMRQIVTGVAVLSIFLLAVGVASAQEGEGGRRIRPQPIRELVRIVAAETGLEPREVVAQVRDGMTLAEVIEANGGDVEAVVASAVAVATERIEAAVTDGFITRERADRLLANLEDVVRRALSNDELFPLRDRPHPGRRIVAASRRALVRQVAEATGLEVDAVVEQLQQGESLAAILTANGVNVEAFTNDIVARAQERLDRAVENGRITQERADAMLARLRERLPEMLNRTLSTASSET